MACIWRRQKSQNARSRNDFEPSVGETLVGDGLYELADDVTLAYRSVVKLNMPSGVRFRVLPAAGDSFVS
jgi:hypothetical protein